MKSFTNAIMLALIVNVSCRINSAIRQGFFQNSISGNGFDLNSGSSGNSFGNGFGSNPSSLGNGFGSNLNSFGNGFNSNPSSSGNGFGSNLNSFGNGFGSNPSSSGNGFGSNLNSFGNGFNLNPSSSGNGFGSNLNSFGNGFNSNPSSSGNGFGSNLNSFENGFNSNPSSSGNGISSISGSNDNSNQVVAPSSGSDDISSARVRGLQRQNFYRQKHHVGSLSLDSSLNDIAQKWAQNLASINKMQHSNGKNGENLYMSCSSSSLDLGKVFEEAADKWYNEINSYNWNNPGFTFQTGHFTQLVWKSSTNLGLGAAVGSNGAQKCVYVVANYSPRGNMNMPGQFQQNVLAA